MSSEEDRDKEKNAVSVLKEVIKKTQKLQYVKLLEKMIKLALQKLPNRQK